jgi:hypothetical protein
VVFTDLTCLATDRRVIDFGSKLDLRIFEGIVVEIEIADIFGTLVSGVYGTVESHIPIEKIVIVEGN